MSLSRLTLLPYAPQIAAGLLLAALLGAAGGLWLGSRIARSATAMAANKALKAETRELRNQLVQQSRQHAATITAMQAAHARLDAIAEQLEHDRGRIEQHTTQQALALRTLAARHPEIRRPLPAGLDTQFLCHWNRAKAVPGTDTATAAIPGCEPDAALPATGNAGSGDTGSDAGRPRPDNAPIPRVPGATDATDTSGAGDAGNRTGVVLPGTQTHGYSGGVR